MESGSSGARGKLEDKRRAGGGVDGADGGGAVDERDARAVEGVGDAAGEVLRLRNPGRLEGEPRTGGGLAGRSSELGGVEVDAAAGGGSVEEDAGGGALVLGDGRGVGEGEWGGGGALAAVWSAGVGTTLKPRAVSSERRRKASAGVTSFSTMLSEMREPLS